MVVWFAHVRVGHRQLSIPDYPPTSYLDGGFSLSPPLFLMTYTLTPYFIKIKLLAEDFKTVHTALLKSLKNTNY